MNIFVLDERPWRCAELHCDAHVIKMILETTQMLCTVQRGAGNQDPELYRATHANHPCTKWAGATRRQYEWTWNLLHALHVQYAERYEKVHASIFLAERLRDAPDGLPDLPLDSFVFCGPDECREASVIASYRNLYNLKNRTFKRSMTWTRATRPDWVTE